MVIFSLMALQIPCGRRHYHNKSRLHSLLWYVKDKTPLNPVYMTVKEWYLLLLEQNVTKRDVDQEGRMELTPCRVEEKFPEVCWAESYRISRLTGLSPEIKSFLFKLIHELLPSKERIHHLSQTSSPLCWCNSGALETYHYLTKTWAYYFYIAKLRPRSSSSWAELALILFSSTHPT